MYRGRRIIVFVRASSPLGQWLWSLQRTMRATPSRAKSATRDAIVPIYAIASQCFCHVPRAGREREQ
jgi:hypothetical protein